MVWLAMIQRRDKLECFVFEVICYFLISASWKILTRPKKKDTALQKYKYEYAGRNFTPVDPIMHDDSDLHKPNLDDVIEEARTEVQEKANRVSNYDFREFRGRKNVPWEEVYDYLWLHCRYKGIPMWLEYMSELVNEGVMSEECIKKVFDKAGIYIPWTPRPELEARDNIETEKVRKRDNHWEQLQISQAKFVDYLKDVGIYDGCEEYYENDRKMCEVHLSDKHLKAFYYDEYLKRKGYI